MRDEAFLAELEQVVGTGNCLTEPDIVASFTTDWTGRYRGEALAVVRPGSAGEVGAVLCAAGRHRAAVIPQGGNTSLVGGSVPRAAAEAGDRPQVVLSLRRLDEVELVEATSRLLLAGAGTTLAVVASAAATVGCRVGIDLAARDSATLGGMVATNAGGLNVFRFGSMRSRLAGLEVVLADGSVVQHLGGLMKDNVGWDASSLFAGSEGTLGVVTRVMLRLERIPAWRITALVACRDLATALDLVAGPLASLPALEAVELTLADGMRLVCEASGLPPAVGAGAGAQAWLTLEAAGDHDPADELGAALEHEGVVDIAVASDSVTRSRLWAYREQHTEAVSREGVAHKLDVSVRPAHIGELVDALPARVAAVAPEARMWLWGHVADGNLHVNVVGPPADDDTVDDAVLRLALELGGSISAEHGVGVARRRWLTSARSAAALDLVARVKHSLDPTGLLNPGVLEPVPPIPKLSAKAAT
jgi:FAD/FMN-containing dehydrogenase